MLLRRLHSLHVDSIILTVIVKRFFFYPLLQNVDIENIFICRCDLIVLSILIQKKCFSLSLSFLCFQFELLGTQPCCIVFHQWRAEKARSSWHIFDTLPHASLALFSMTWLILPSYTSAVLPTTLATVLHPDEEKLKVHCHCCKQTLVSSWNIVFRTFPESQPYVPHVFRKSLSIPTLEKCHCSFINLLARVDWAVHAVSHCDLQKQLSLVMCTL